MIHQVPAWSARRRLVDINEPGHESIDQLARQHLVEHGRRVPQVFEDVDHVDDELDFHAVALRRRADVPDLLLVLSVTVNDPRTTRKLTPLAT